MKKVLFLSLAASAVMASCSNEVLDSVVPQEPQAISFDNAFVDKGTRAVNDINGDNIQNIFVYGSKNNIQFFENVKVTKSGEAWTYTDVKFWEADQTYKFIAYSDGGNSIQTPKYNATDGTLEFANYKVGEKDLLVSNLDIRSITASATGNANVAFTLGHALAKVKFTITNNCGDGTNVKITNLKFTADGTGTYNVANGYENSSWTMGEANDKEYSFATKENIANGASNEAEEFYVIPQSTSGLTASFTATLTTPANGTKEANFENIPLTVTHDWKQGYFYNYTASLTPAKFDMQQIIFDVTEVKGWENNDVTLPDLDPIK